MADHLGAHRLMILAVTLSVVGQLDLAMMAADQCDFERALASLFARMLIELQRGEEALKEIDRIPLLAPELFVPGQRSYLKAMALGLTKRFDEAARELTLAEKAGFDPKLIEGERAIADLEQGRWVEAEQRLQRLLSTPRAMKELTSSVYNFASLRSKQGRQAEALELLRTAVASGFGDLRQLATGPDFDALRRVFPKEVNAMIERATGRCSTW